MSPAPAPAPAPRPGRSNPSQDGDASASTPTSGTDGSQPRAQGPRNSRGPSRNNNRNQRGGNSGSRSMRDARRPSRGMGAPAAKKPVDYHPDPVASNVVRIVPLGGVEEVGRNMVALEVGDDIYVFDVGFQFVSEEAAPGVDYMLPNTTYLERNASRVRGVFITHGHLDHIAVFLSL